MGFPYPYWRQGRALLCKSHHTRFVDGCWDSCAVAGGEECTHMGLVAFPWYGSISCCCSRGNLVFHLDVGEGDLWDFPRGIQSHENGWSQTLPPAWSTLSTTPLGYSDKKASACLKTNFRQVSERAVLEWWRGPCLHWTQGFPLNPKTAPRGWRPLAQNPCFTANVFVLLFRTPNASKGLMWTLKNWPMKLRKPQM